jgi:hypothetical protein
MHNANRDILLKEKSFSSVRERFVACVCLIFIPMTSFLILLKQKKAYPVWFVVNV